jgi:tRNA G18 (ribose-2'-O)-methylase SpoU
MASDPRLPHLAARIDKQITKTSLGAEKTLAWRHEESLELAIKQLKASGYALAALEQANGSIKVPDFRPPDKLALIVGNEVTGLTANELALADLTLEIPMLGAKESYNVASAAAMALFYCRFSSSSSSSPSSS